MEITKTHLFVILLLALILCSFFGGNCGSGLEGYINANANSDVNTLATAHAMSKTSGSSPTQYSSYSDMYSGKNNARDSRDSRDARNTRKNDDIAATTTKYAPYQRMHKTSNGIRANQILPGQEDLYILKSEVIPPVCPVCPSVKSNGSKGANAEKCPPCPPCARCPEPAFDCKKVPNYNRVNDDFMPYPALNSFAQFGL